MAKKIKWKRVWCFGDDRKMDEDDFVVAYETEGARINVEYLWSGRYYEYNKRQYLTLKAAKEAFARSDLSRFVQTL